MGTYRLANWLGAIELNNTNCCAGNLGGNDVVDQRSALNSIRTAAALLHQFNLAGSFKFTRDALPNLRACQRQKHGLTRGLNFDVVGQIVADILQLKISHALGVGFKRAPQLNGLRLRGGNKNNRAFGGVETRAIGHGQFHNHTFTTAVHIDRCKLAGEFAHLLTRAILLNGGDALQEQSLLRAVVWGRGIHRGGVGVNADLSNFKRLAA